MPQSRGKTKRDANQPDFEEDMGVIGATTLDLSSVGGGAGDILVGWQRGNWFFELKDPEQDPNKRKLRPNQVDFHSTWRGQIDRVEYAHEAMAIMGVDPKTIDNIKRARAAKDELKRRIQEKRRGR